ncbi:MAG: response regulator, partial [Campylobacterota bacterium]|nr:response regulator [Campylobacterota bacterium]
MDLTLVKQTLTYLESLTLLCVEDDKDIRIAYRDIFEDLVDRLIFAVDGKDGYEKFINEDIDIIVTDYHMPNLNGLEMIEQIRAINKDIPIVLITAINGENIIIKALQLHVNNFIQKP